MAPLSFGTRTAVPALFVISKAPDNGIISKTLSHVKSTGNSTESSSTAKAPFLSFNLGTLSNPLENKETSSLGTTNNLGASFAGLSEVEKSSDFASNLTVGSLFSGLASKKEGLESGATVKTSIIHTGTMISI